MWKNIVPIAAAVVALLAMFTGVTYAQSAMTGDEGTLLDLARPIYEQIVAGHYLAAAAAALVCTVAAIKRYAPGKFGELVHSDAGGSLTTLLLAFGGALFTATLGGVGWEMFNTATLWAALKVGVTAAGGYALAKKLIVEPILKPLAAKYPNVWWLQRALQLVFFFFDKQLVADATAAGDAAVAASPAGGLAGVAGKPPTEMQ